MNKLIIACIARTIPESHSLNHNSSSLVEGLLDLSTYEAPEIKMQGMIQSIYLASILTIGKAQQDVSLYVFIPFLFYLVFVLLLVTSIFDWWV